MLFCHENIFLNILNISNKSIFNPLEEFDSNNKLNDNQKSFLYYNKNYCNLYEIYKNKKEKKIYIAHTTTFKNILNIYYLNDIFKAELSHCIKSESIFLKLNIIQLIIKNI